ncbi:MAG TPA: alanine racemase [Gemmatimonadales bacterium]|jgi:D-serine deaminase-like pyridoxal phosphate-dependent protein
MARRALADLPTPALLVDLDKLEANVTHMAGRAKSLGVALRPHVKTHKCIEIGRLQRDHGASGITVSTLVEARAFADHGFDDITWAFPVILTRLTEARELAERITLGLVLDSAEALAALERSGFPFTTWIKVDCGYHRAGVDPHSDDALRLVERLAKSKALRFAGLLTHSGHAYHARGTDEIRAVAEEERRAMTDFAARLGKAGIAVPAVSVGSTPAMSQVQQLKGVQEMRPGNYVFYDYMQTVIGSCGVRDCALTVLASVVSNQRGTNHSVIDAGALALSKDAGLETYPQATMGELYEDYPSGTLMAGSRVVGLSQEHGFVSGVLPVGTRVRVLPNHSCLTAAQFDGYDVVRGDEVVDRWPIWRGR